MSFFVRTGVLSGFSQLVVELGADPEPIFQQLGLAADTLDGEDNLITMNAVNAMLDAAVKSTKCDYFSMMLANRQDVSFVGVIGLALKAAPDIRTVLREVLRYLSIHVQGAEWHIKVDGKLTHCSWTHRWEHRSPGDSDWRNSVYLAVGQLFCVLRELSGESWTPVCINFHYDEPEQKWFYKSFFHAPVVFSSDFDGFVFNSCDLDIVISERQDKLLSVLDDYMENLKEDTADELSQQVKHVIRQSIVHGKCDFNQIAGVFNTSKRTLQRKLKMHDTSFQQLRKEVRFELATQYLRETNKSLSNVSELIGFAELSIFSRTFKNRFGESPTQWRKNHGSSDKAGL